MATYTTNYNLIKPAVNDPTDQDLWGGYLNDSLDLIDTQMKTNADAIASAVPSGSIFDFAGTAAPTGYLLCFGQDVDRTTYADLFAVIGTTYGIGDGATTFGLPDLRGRVTAGQDDMGGTSADRLTGLSGGVDGDVLGGTGGSESHTLVEGELPSLTKEVKEEGDDLPLSTTSSGSGTYTDIPQEGTGGDTGRLIVEFGSDDPHNNVQPTIILNKIIKT